MIESTPSRLRANCRRGSSCAFSAVMILLAGALLAGAILRPGPAHASPDNFESPPVHPVELTPDGARLLVAHIADGSVVVFDASGGSPVRLATLPVGLEPVSIRARTANEAWVVNHVSDSVSILDLTTGNVVRTLLVGDEPSDVAFAAGRAFVAISGQDALAVFSLADLDASPTRIPLPQSQPRTLAVSPDGSRLYVAALESGNRTTVIPGPAVTAGGGPPAPDPPMSITLPRAPEVALIVKHDGLHWRDEIDRDWDPFVPYTLRDADVVEIDPSTLTIVREHRGAGTSLFDLEVVPSNGRIWVSNLEASNHVRFEPNVQGRFAKNRVTWIDPSSGDVVPVHLNPHIDYGDPAGNPGERSLSLALPLDLASRADGAEVFVAAQGSDLVGAFDAAGAVQRRFPVGAGPCGLALDEPRERLYVYNRFASSLSVIDLASEVVTTVSLGHDPSSLAVRMGRRHLYGASTHSAHGDLACASCHLFGASDGLAWDLGDPEGVYVGPVSEGFTGFHPMKGPMVTQPLTGLAGTAPFHWRGDRDELEDFDPAFVNLMGRATALGPAEFEELVSFLLTVRRPPNPRREIDDTLPNPATGPNATTGEKLFRFGDLTEAGDCAACHTGATGESGNLTPGPVCGSTQDMDIPQMRGLYEKRRFDETAAENVRGFGFTHDGTLSLDSFLRTPRFKLSDPVRRADVTAFLLAFGSGSHAAIGAQWTDDGSEQAQFIPAGDAYDVPSTIDGEDRVSALLLQADLQRLDVIVKGRDEAGLLRGWVYDAAEGTFLSDRQAEPTVTPYDLRELAAPGRELTYTAVIEGTGVRLGIDRDGDGVRDRDERDAGTDPNDPSSAPDVVAIESASGLTREARLEISGRNPAVLSTSVRVTLPSGARDARLRIFDASGRALRSLSIDDAEPVGIVVPWDLRDARGELVPSGVYFVRLEAGEFALARKITVAR